MRYQLPLPPPVSCGARCAYAAYLGSGALAVILLLLACGEGQPQLAAGAVLAAVSALLLRAQLASAGVLAACAEEDDTPLPFHPRVATAHQREFELLQGRYEELEKLRGTAQAKPWALLELRRRLAAGTRSSDNESNYG